MKVATGTADKDEAQRSASLTGINDAMQRATQLAVSGRLDSRAARDLVNDLLTAAGHETLDAVSNRAWCETWRASKAGSVKDRSKKKYVPVSRDWLAFLNGRADKPLESVTRADGIATAEGDWRGLVLLAASSGLRPADGARLQWRNLNLTAGRLAVKTAKTGATVTLPIHPKFRKWLDAQPRGNSRAPVSPSLAKKSGAGKTGLSMHFQRLMARAKISDGVARQAAKKVVKLIAAKQYGKSDAPGLWRARRVRASRNHSPGLFKSASVCASKMRTRQRAKSCFASQTTELLEPGGFGLGTP